MSAVNPQNPSDAELTCAICLELMEVVSRLEHCGHKFCFRCIKSVLHHNGSSTRCPLCRHAFNFNDIIVLPLFLRWRAHN